MAHSDPNIPHHDPHGPEALPGDELAEQIDERWLALIDTALKVQSPLARSYVAKLRLKHPDATDRQLLEHVTKRFISLTTLTGAGIGGVAALPGLGTAAALGLTVGEGVSFAEACAFLTLASAEVHGVDMTDSSTRRLVLMGVLGGERGTRIIARRWASRAAWQAVLGGGGVPPGLSASRSRVRAARVSRAGGLGLECCPSASAPCSAGSAPARSRSVVEAMLEIFAHGTTLEGEIARRRAGARASRPRQSRPRTRGGRPSGRPRRRAPAPTGRAHTSWVNSLACSVPTARW